MYFIDNAVSVHQAPSKKETWGSFLMKKLTLRDQFQARLPRASKAPLAMTARTASHCPQGIPCYTDKIDWPLVRKTVHLSGSSNT